MFHKPGFLASMSALFVALAVPGGAGAQWRTIYQEDFSSDPGWVTDQPANYGWDSSLEAYRATVLNAGQWPSRYAYSGVDYRGESFRLEFDTMAVSLGWSAGYAFGLFNSDLSIFNNERPSARGVFVHPGRADQGRAFELHVIGQNGIAMYDQIWNLISEGTWYRCVIEYDATTDTVTCVLRERETGNQVGRTLVVSGFGGLPDDLDYLGFARDPVGSCCPSCSGYSCSASATGYVDNVTLAVGLSRGAVRVSRVNVVDCRASVRVHLESLQPTRGFSFGFTYPEWVARLVDILPGGAFDEIGAPDLWEKNTAATSCESGVSAGSLGCVISLRGSRELPPGRHEVAVLVFERQVSDRDKRCESGRIEFRDACVGDPPVSVVIVTPEGDVVPETEGGDLVPGNSCFLRGDADSNGRITIGDAVKIIYYLFREESVLCEDALDADDSGEITQTDALVVVGYLFRAGWPPPAQPYPELGGDPTPDGLSCESCE